jgi:ribosomal protein S18 acetylase RimI-like enzyme
LLRLPPGHRATEAPGAGRNSLSGVRSIVPAVTQFEVTRATPDIRQRVVGTVVAAFAADPAFRYFFRDGGEFTAQATTFAGHLFDKRVTTGTVWVIDGGASVAMWDPPDPADPHGEATSAKAPQLPPATLARLDAYDVAVHQALPRTPHWYLGVLATHPASAGQRWGRAVMVPGLASATSAGLPAYLETTNPDNVDLYRRAGWDVTATFTIDAISVWVMRHPAGMAST